MRGFSIDHSVAMYGLLGVQMIALVIWTLWRPNSPRAGACFGALFTLGSAMATTIGLCLAPVSVFALFAFGLGILGFLPFYTAMIFARNATEASQSDTSSTRRLALVPAYALGVILAVSGALAEPTWQRLTGIRWNLATSAAPWSEQGAPTLGSAPHHGDGRSRLRARRIDQVIE